jgi:hypothetical protein
MKPDNFSLSSYFKKKYEEESKSLNENPFKKRIEKNYGQKLPKEMFKKLKNKQVIYLGKLYDVVEVDDAIVKLKDQGGKIIDVNYSMFNQGGFIKDLKETIELGKKLNEDDDDSKLCNRGKEYIKARKKAGEKSSAYLSGRAVRVCKGQIKFKGKKRDDYD